MSRLFEIGERFPDFVLPGSSGQPTQLYSRVGGRPVLVLIYGDTFPGLDQLIETAFTTREAWSRRVGTGELNRWFERAIAANPPPAPGGRRIKLRYVTQAKTRPPGFVLFLHSIESLKSYSPY